MSFDSRLVLKNATWLYSAEILSRVLSVFLTITIARQLGASDLGRLVFVSSLIGIASVFSDFGLSIYLIRSLSRNKEDWLEQVSTNVVLRIVSSFFISCVVIVYTVGTVKETIIAQMIYFSLGSLLVSIYSSIIFTLYRVNEKMSYESIAKVISALIYSVFGILLILSGFGILSIVILAFVLSIVNSIYAWRYGRSLPNFKIKISKKHLLRVLVGSLPFGALAVFVTISFRIDSLMIEHILGIHDVGIYGSAYRIMEMFLVIPGVLAGAIMPAVAKIIETEKDRVIGVVTRAIRLLWVLAVPLSFGIYFFADQVLRIIYGNKFNESSPVLVVLGFTLIPLFASALTSLIITSGNKPQINTGIALVMMLLNIALNLWLIPKWGILGAGVATLLTECFGLLMGTIFINIYYAKLNYFYLLAKPIVGSLAMGGIIILTSVNIWLTPLYALTYFLTLYTIKGVNKSDWILILGASPLAKYATREIR